MRVFERPNTTHGFICPVCQTGAIAPVVLVPIPGTDDDGLVEAKQVHADCYEIVRRMRGKESSNG